MLPDDAPPPLETFLNALLGFRFPTIEHIARYVPDASHEQLELISARVALSVAHAFRLLGPACVPFCQTTVTRLLRPLSLLARESSAPAPAASSPTALAIAAAQAMLTVLAETQLLSDLTRSAAKAKMQPAKLQGLVNAVTGAVVPLAHASADTASSALQVLSGCYSALSQASHVLPTPTLRVLIQAILPIGISADLHQFLSQPDPDGPSGISTHEAPAAHAASDAQHLAASIRTAVSSPCQVSAGALAALDAPMAARIPLHIASRIRSILPLPADEQLGLSADKPPAAGAKRIRRTPAVRRPPSLAVPQSTVDALAQELCGVVALAACAANGFPGLSPWLAPGGEIMDVIEAHIALHPHHAPRFLAMRFAELVRVIAGPRPEDDGDARPK
jgi:hypothetical protein